MKCGVFVTRIPVEYNSVMQVLKTQDSGRTTSVGESSKLRFPLGSHLDNHPAMSDLEKFQKYVEANENRFIERLSKAVAIPSYALSLPA